METRGRALFNLLALNLRENPSIPVEKWQVENYRNLSTQELFSRLENLKISLNEKSLASYVEEMNSPEELADVLTLDEDEEQFYKVYLIIFELWRRFFPEKQSLSIFCDELDAFMELYDSDAVLNDVNLQETLMDLRRILDQNTDQGEDPHELFQEVSLYCAHDLESFIYDYAANEIDKDNILGASEIVDSFIPYVSHQIWFKFLQILILASSEPKNADTLLNEFITEQGQNADFELLVEILSFFEKKGTPPQFLRTLKLALPFIQTEEDFEILLSITHQFYNLLDREEEAKKILNLLKKRENIHLEQEITDSDQDVVAFSKLVEDFNRNEM